MLRIHFLGDVYLALFYDHPSLFLFFPVLSLFLCLLVHYEASPCSSMSFSLLHVLQNRYIGLRCFWRDRITWTLVAALLSLLTSVASRFYQVDCSVFHRARQRKPEEETTLNTPEPHTRLLPGCGSDFASDGRRRSLSCSCFMLLFGEWQLKENTIIPKNTKEKSNFLCVRSPRTVFVEAS